MENIRDSKFKNNKLVRLFTISFICLILVFSNVTSKNEVYAAQLPPGYEKQVGISICMTAMMTYLTRIGISIVGNTDDVIDYLYDKCVEYGLAAAMLAKGVWTNITNRKILLDNETIGLYNQFVDNYVNDSDYSNNIIVNDSIGNSLNMYYNNNLMPYFDNVVLDYNNMKGVIDIYNNQFTAFRNIYNNSSIYDNRTIYLYYPNNQFYNKLDFTLGEYSIYSVNGKSGVYISDVRLEQSPFTASGLTQSTLNSTTKIFYADSTSSYYEVDDMRLFFCRYKAGNYYYLLPVKICEYLDNNNNICYIFQSLIYENLYHNKYLYLMNINDFNNVQYSNNTYIDNSNINTNLLLSQLDNLNEAYTLQFNSINQNIADNNQLLSAILSAITNGDVASSSVISTETGMTDEEAQNTNWFTIIKNAISNVFTPDNSLTQDYDNDYSAGFSAIDSYTNSVTNSNTGVQSNTFTTALSSSLSATYELVDSFIDMLPTPFNLILIIPLILVIFLAIVR